MRRMLLGVVSLTISGGISMLVDRLISSRKYGSKNQKEPKIQETMVFLSILQENDGVVLL